MCELIVVLDAETRLTFEDILAESMEAGNLLEDMLALARVDEGRLAVNLVPLDLLELLDEVCDKVRAMDHAKHQSFTTQFPAARPLQVAADRPTLRACSGLSWTTPSNTRQREAASR